MSCYFCETEKIDHSIGIENLDSHYEFCIDCLSEMTADECFQQLYEEKNYIYPPQPEVFNEDPNYDPISKRNYECTLCRSPKIRIKRLFAWMSTGWVFNFCENCLLNCTASIFFKKLNDYEDYEAQNNLQEMMRGIGRGGNGSTKKKTSSNKLKERGKLTDSMRYKIMRRDDFHCVICGATGKENTLVIDHIIPIAKEGKTIVSNLRTLCTKCNAGKGTKLDSDSI